MKFEQERKIKFLKKAFGTVERSNDGKNVAVRCPACKDSTKRKLAIRLDDDRVNCWVCSLKGRLVYILKIYRTNLVHEYIETFGIAKIELKDVEVALPSLPKSYKLLMSHQNDISTAWARSYLKKRSLTNRDMWYFKFGVSSEPEFRRRVIMPSFDVKGTLNFFTARAVDQNTYRKYWNSSNPKKDIIFNEINLNWSEEITLVEGPFDLVKCDNNATCLLGSSLTEDFALFAKLYKHKTPVVLALDADMQEKEWQKIAKMLNSYDIPVRIADLGKASDVGEMTKEQFLIAKKNATPWDRDLALRKKINSIKSRKLF